MSLKDKLAKDNDEHGGQGDMFQFEKSGTYKMRILNEPVLMATHFFGKGNPSVVCVGKDKGCPFHGGDYAKAALKYYTYIILRAKNKDEEDVIKLAELPYSVISAIADWEEDEDWGFDEYPLPYDITVKVDKENNDPKQIYKSTPSPKRIDLTQIEMTVMAQKMEHRTPENYVKERKEKAMEKAKGLMGGAPEYEEDEIPM